MVASPTAHLQRGQTIVIFALGLVAMLAMVGLIIDGSNAYAQQRRTQNGADGAAEAGAVQLARRLVGTTAPSGNWDTDVVNAVNATAQDNEVDLPLDTIEYVNLQGAPVGAAGTGSVPGSAAGVHVIGHRTFGTTFARVVGIDQFTATTEATAIAGYGTQTSAGGVIPVTIPVLLASCNNTSALTLPGGAPWPVGQRLAVPLCKNDPGNVGWIDWTPPAGGASEIADEITTPSNPTITTPKWYSIAQTGDPNSSQIQAALDTLDNTDVLIPIFYADASNPAAGTCNTTPGGDKTQLSDCPAANVGGNGSNQWYYLVTFGEFHLEHAWVQGSHTSECNDPSLLTISGGNGGTSCLVGEWNGPVVASELTIDRSGGGSHVDFLTPVTTQLIK